MIMKINLMIPFVLLSSCSLFGAKNEIFVSQKRIKTEEVKRSRKPAQANTNLQSKRVTQTNKINVSQPQKLKLSKVTTPLSSSTPQILETQKSTSKIHVNAAPQSKRVEVTTYTLPAHQVVRTEFDLAHQKNLLKAMQAAYDQASTHEFIKLYEEFKNIPNLERSLASQGHYLAGLFYYATKSYGASIQSFDLMLAMKDLHESDKVKAIFGKAQTFKKMNIPEQSVLLYEEIIAKYPTSHEASRAAVELQKLRGEF
jgi:hypothetical protein